MSISILSTSLLTPDLIAKAKDIGVELDTVEFIQLTNIANRELAKELNEIATGNGTIIFTSANAVKAVIALIEGSRPNWDIYCIGNATRAEVLLHFDALSIKGAANDAAALAKKIVADGVREAIFFCGDRRMGILPTILQEHKIMLREVVVYEMKEVPLSLNKDYDGILFYSPSGVRSFFSANTVKTGCVLFAIGNTTGAEVEQYTANQLVICKDPSKEQMLADAIQLLNKGNSLNL